MVNARARIYTCSITFDPSVSCVEIEFDRQGWLFGSARGALRIMPLVVRLKRLILALFCNGHWWTGRLRATGVHESGVARALRRTRERNPEGELRLSNLLAKLLNLEIGFCNVDRHKGDLDQRSELNHKPIAWLGTT
jgi:hypothetical protein